MERIRVLFAERPGEEIAIPGCLPPFKAADPRRELKARFAVAISSIAVLELFRGQEVVATQTEPQEPIRLSAWHP